MHNFRQSQVFKDGSKQETVPVDGKAFYLFGREPTTVDIVLNGPGASRTHAALVHHEDGKSYLIDLSSVRSAKTGIMVSGVSSCSRS